MLDEMKKRKRAVDDVDLVAGELDTGNGVHDSGEPVEGDFFVPKKVGRGKRECLGCFQVRPTLLAIAQ